MCLGWWSLTAGLLGAPTPIWWWKQLLINRAVLTWLWLDFPVPLGKGRCPFCNLWSPATDLKPTEKDSKTRNQRSKQRKQIKITFYLEQLSPLPLWGLLQRRKAEVFKDTNHSCLNSGDFQLYTAFHGAGFDFLFFVFPEKAVVGRDYKCRIFIWLIVYHNIYVMRGRGSNSWSEPRGSDIRLLFRLLSRLNCWPAELRVLISILRLRVKSCCIPGFLYICLYVVVLHTA